MRRRRRKIRSSRSFVREILWSLCVSLVGPVSLGFVVMARGKWEGGD